MRSGLQTNIVRERRVEIVIRPTTRSPTASSALDPT